MVDLETLVLTVGGVDDPGLTVDSGKGDGWGGQGGDVEALEGRRGESGAVTMRREGVTLESASRGRHQQGTPLTPHPP